MTRVLWLVPEDPAMRLLGHLLLFQAPPVGPRATRPLLAPVSLSVQTFLADYPV